MTPNLSFVPRKSPNYNDRKDGARPSMIILHYTGMETAQAALKKLTDKDSDVSAHYTVDEDGTLYHHVDEDKRAWHAGASFWRGITDINSHSIGIEIVNPGHEWGYRPFTGHQMRALDMLCHDIMVRHDIPADYILAHSDIAPSRKQDPGELFPWEELARHGVGVWPAPSDEDVIKSSGMDIMVALHDFGYDPTAPSRDVITAFQRRYVPESFTNGHAGEADSATRARLYALLAGHLLEPAKR